MKESTTNPGHRRLVSKQSTLLDDPTKATTTTRALLVAVVAPCKFSTINTSNIIGNALDDTDDESSLGDSNSKKKTDAKAPAKIYDAPPQETESGRKVHPLLADKNVAASTKENIQLTHSSSLRNDNEGGEAGELEEAENDAIPLREAASRVESQEITPEEAAAVTMGKDPSSSEIHVEELLRITFQTLLDEYHLLNLPTFSRVDDKKLYKNASLNVEIQEEPTPFVRMEVMARPASLGIILERLERIGVGTNVGTVSIYKAELCRTASPYLTLPVKEEVPEADVPIVNNPVDADRGAEISDRVEAADDAQNSDSAEDAEKLQTERQIQEARAEWKNAATRLRIEQIREQIADSAALSFDFISLLTIAGILAGIGLITNNSVVLVASMLVSPIMGPVLGLTFGSRVGDWPLVITSLKNESLALLGCILIGVLLGLCVGFTDLAQETWPTNEMEIRGEYTGLLIGLAVAIPSGAGVCLSILGGNTSSLVGVAISASLLPPAVNAGICFMYAILLELDAVSPDSQKSASDLAIIGAVSFALTGRNSSFRLGLLRDIRFESSFSHMSCRINRCSVEYYLYLGRRNYYVPY